jgi:hypothetical protein
VGQEKPNVVLITELAKEAGVTVVNIRQLLHSGALKGQKHGGIWIIPREEADRYLAARKGRQRAKLRERRPRKKKTNAQ